MSDIDYLLEDTTELLSRAGFLRRVGFLISIETLFLTRHLGLFWDISYAAPRIACTGKDRASY